MGRGAAAADEVGFDDGEGCAATGAEFAVIPPQNASGNWIKVTQRVPVRIRVEMHDGAPPLRAGLSAHVSVETGRRRTLSDLLP